MGRSIGVGFEIFLLFFFIFYRFLFLFSQGKGAPGLGVVGREINQHPGWLGSLCILLPSGGGGGGVGYSGGEGFLFFI